MNWPMTRQRRRLFDILAGAEGEWVATRELAHALYGQGLPEQRLAVRVHIHGLRRALAGTNREIVSAYRRGYRLTNPEGGTEVRP